MNNVSRRDFLKKTSLATAAVPFASIGAENVAKAVTNPLESIPSGGPVKVFWLEGGQPVAQSGKAFGVPWPRGQFPKDTKFTMRTPSGQSVPVQTWITATWPDGSIKWTGHAIAPGLPAFDYFEIVEGKPVEPATPVSVIDENDHVSVDTGVIQCKLLKKGNTLISSVKRQDKTILEGGALTGSRQDSPEPGFSRESFTSNIEKVEIEQSGPIRAVVKIDGHHQTEKGRNWLPFSVRLYFHAGSDDIRITHTFIFDGDEHKDFISSLGMQFKVVMHDELYNRHVRFSGQENGLWAEAVQGLTGLRRDPGKEVREAQIAGQMVPDIQTWNKAVSTRVHWIPTWGDFSLTQSNANGFTIKKRTKPGHAWIQSDQGGRSDGLGYIGGPSGGVAFGMRDFWKLHPTQLDVRDSISDGAEVTLWIWSPEAPPMDIRFYHDGLGQEVEGPLENVEVEGIELSIPETPYDKQLDALEVTYEDYEPGFGTPHGVARSTDITLKIVDATPTREALASLADEIALPPQLVPRPEDMLNAGVFGPIWDLPNRSTEQLASIEDQLDWFIQHYKDQVEQHHWYGFWDYGDVMHTYDRDRHVWRYDIGGFAWDNSELSTDLMLWYTYLRSGNVDAFRLAEAMNRHNRDVDIYHLGRFVGLGTRHNVQHWGCSAKQLRVSTCANRRFHYFLTTDERTGDVLAEVIEADKTIASLDAHRKIYHKGANPEFANAHESPLARINSGTDYGAVLSNWLTAWERTGDAKYRSWIENSMKAIGGSKWGFFADGYWFDPVTKAFTEPEGIKAEASHLKIMFGLPEIMSEILELIDVPEFEAAWLRYCRLWNGTEEEMKEELGEVVRKPGFDSAHARLTAYAAKRLNDKALAARAESEFNSGNRWQRATLETQRISGPDVLNPVDEASWVSTNNTAQWGLTAIQSSALIPDAISKK